MCEERVFQAIARLAADGEYLDQIPGKPGVDLDGSGVFGPSARGMRRIYRRGSRDFQQARARGWIEALPPLTPAPPAAVAEAESLAGLPLPPLLRRLYLEVGNGGFGPGYGLLGLAGGHQDDLGATAVTYLRSRRPRSGRGPKVPLVLCHWGCAITSEIDLSDGQIWGSDPNPAPASVCHRFPQQMTLTDWLGRWIEDRLYQPWLVQDPATGEWRGATDDEYAAELEQWDGEEL